MTIAICALRDPSATASIKACRLLPRPEIRIPIRLVPGSTCTIFDTPGTGHNAADRRRRRFTGSCEVGNHAIGVLGVACQDEPDSHVEGPQHVLVGHISGPL